MFSNTRTTKCSIRCAGIDFTSSVLFQSIIKNRIPCLLVNKNTSILKLKDCLLKKKHYAIFDFYEIISFL